MADTADADEVHRVVSTAVDAAFYRAAYPDLDAPDIDPIRHYVEHGWREGRDPAPWFSVRRYLEANPDVAQADLEPLYHYLTYGWIEGRSLAASKHAWEVLKAQRRRGRVEAWRFEPWSWEPPSEPDDALVEAETEAAAPPFNEAERHLVAAEFNETYYLAFNQDVREQGRPPLEHFLEHGWRDGRDPNADFSVRDYLDANPDVAAAKVNPFIHYLTVGRAEGRAPRGGLGFRYRIIANSLPMTTRIACAAAAAATQVSQRDATLAKAMERSRSGLRDLHISFSHDDYTAHVGGIQVCVQRESAGVAELGRDHLHLYPASTPPPENWPVVRTGREAARLGVIWNGQNVGVFSARIVARVLTALLPAPGARSFAVHSLLGHSVDEVGEILSAARMKSGFFWLHDFASLCAGYHLLRDDVEDCGAPPPDSAACGICLYGPWRARHLSEHERLFSQFEVTVVSPSESALKLWREAWRFPIKAAVVHPHARLTPRAEAPAARPREPFRVAYVGVPASHKGWPVFEGLVRRFGCDPRYRFLHLGARTAPGLAAEFHQLTVSAERPDAMQQAIEDLAIDAVLMWPLCRETFSFAAYEAVAGGAALITWPDSGNVAAFVESTGFGLVLPDEPSLAQLFETGAAAELSRAVRKPRLFDMEFSGMTADLLEQGVAA